MKIICRKKPGEIFKELVDGYLISNYGRIYSTKRKRILKQEKNSGGYHRVKLSIDGSTKYIFVHIKVVELFGDCHGTVLVQGLTLREQHLSIDHIDGIKRHNQQFNLEIVTHSENCIRRNRMVKEKCLKKLSY